MRNHVLRQSQDKTLVFRVHHQTAEILSDCDNKVTSYNNNHFMTLCQGLPGWSGTRRNIHLPTILIIIQSLSASSSTMIDSLPCSNYMFGNLCEHVSTSSLAYLLVWSPPSHIPYISSPNPCLLFGTHAHTIATCFAVVPRLYHLFLILLSVPYLGLSFTLTLHIYLTILISARWSATSFFPDRPGLASV